MLEMLNLCSQRKFKASTTSVFCFEYFLLIIEAFSMILWKYFGFFKILKYLFVILWDLKNKLYRRYDEVNQAIFEFV